MPMLNTGSGTSDVSKNYVDSELRKKVNNEELNNYITFSVDDISNIEVPNVQVLNEVYDDYKVSGTTNERPRNGNVGQMYFDTDLNKPIWRNSNNNGWVDSNGFEV